MHYLRSIAATLLASLPLTAQTWNESTPFLAAGELPIDAQATRGIGTLARIVGELADDENADFFVIRIDDPATFSVSSVGGAAFDSQLWLFDRNGVGIAFRDDDPGVLQSTLTGQFVLQPGHYIVGISRYDDDALDVAGQELWNDQPYNVERLADGPGGTLIASWSGPGTGNPVDPYTLTLTGASFAYQAGDAMAAWAYVRMNPFSAPSVPADASYSVTGERIFVTKIATGVFDIDLGDSTGTGAPQVTAIGNHVAAIESWNVVNSPTLVRVRTFTPGGTPADGSFFLFFQGSTYSDERFAQCYASQPTVASYTPSGFSQGNGNRALLSIQRTATGRYSVTIPGLATAGQPHRGHVQVSPVLDSGLSMCRARVRNWFSQGADLVVNVETWDAANNLADQRFSLLYTERAVPVAPHLGSGAHVWADQPSAASYVPNPLYTDGNAVGGPANAENITRLGVGHYRVELPSVGSDGVIALASSYGIFDSRAYVSSWAGNGAGGLEVEVRTIDPTGAAADAYFTLMAVNAVPAGNAARNTVIGGGCGGLLLSAVGRPVLGDAWDLAVSSPPPGSLLGLVALGLANPAFPLAVIGAPGCVAYQDLLSLVTLPAPSAAWSLPVPAQVNLIGASVFAQGVVFAPGFNAFGFATSNGVEGVFGDV